MQRVILFIILALVGVQFSMPLVAQQDSASNQSGATMTIGAEYSTNTSAFGNVDGYVSQPSYLASFSFTGKHGLNLSFVPHFIGNSDSTNSKFTSQYDFGAGYTLSLFKGLSITPSYTHYLYSKNSLSLASGFSDYAQINAGLSVKWWGLSVAAGYGWGQVSDISVTPSTSVTVSFDNVLGEGNSLEFQPTVGLVMNQNQLAGLNTKKKLTGLEALVKLYPNMTASDFLTSTDPAIVAWRNAHPAVVANITKRLDKTNGKNGKKQKGALLSDLLAPSQKATFGLTSINVTLPITYNLNDFSFNSTFSYSKPNSNSGTSEFYVSFGVSYSFGL